MFPRVFCGNSKPMNLVATPNQIRPVITFLHYHLSVFRFPNFSHSVLLDTVEPKVIRTFYNCTPYFTLLSILRVCMRGHL